MKKERPSWLKKRIPAGSTLNEMEKRLRDHHLNTVCESARCPNIEECFSRQTATFMIMGNTCTRSCKFCAVDGGKPEDLDPSEPQNVAQMVKILRLKHAVITSVTRDDLEDGGVQHFVDTVAEIKRVSPETSVEILTPDFWGKIDLLKILANADWQVFNHNIETVPRLYEKVRPEADYNRSLDVLATMGELCPGRFIKSGLMLGLGEGEAEVITVLEDLYRAGCRLLTLGQYLQPSPQHLPVEKYVHPQEFERYRVIAEKIGLKGIASGPFVRSSYQAETMFNKQV